MVAVVVGPLEVTSSGQVVVRLEVCRSSQVTCLETLPPELLIDVIDITLRALYDPSCTTPAMPGLWISKAFYALITERLKFHTARSVGTRNDETSLSIQMLAVQQGGSTASPVAIVHFCSVGRL